MKSRIIGIISGLAIVTLFVLSFVFLSRGRSALAVTSVVISLIPMYFLYATSVLGKYKSIRKPASSQRNTISKSAGKRKYSDIQSFKGGSNDYGKVLDFPKDGSRKSNKNK